MPNLASLIRDAERMRGAVRVVGPDDPADLPPAERHDRAMDRPLEPNYTKTREIASPVASEIRLTEDQMQVLTSSLAPPPEVMTLGEAATYLRLGRSSVLGLVHEDGLPALKIAGKWRFKRSALDQWLEGRLIY